MEIKAAMARNVQEEEKWYKGNFEKFKDVSGKKEDQMKNMKEEITTGDRLPEPDRRVEGPERCHGDAVGEHGECPSGKHWRARGHHCPPGKPAVQDQARDEQFPEELPGDASHHAEDGHRDHLQGGAGLRKDQAGHFGMLSNTPPESRPICPLS